LAGHRMGTKWAHFGHKTVLVKKISEFSQSKKCAKLMKYKRKVLGISGSYGWT